MVTSPTPDTLSWRQRLQNWSTHARARISQQRLSLSWAFIIFGILGSGAAAWPLATTVWDLFGLSAGQAWRLAGLGVCTLLLAVGVAVANQGRTSPARLIWLILAAWFVAAGAVTAMTTLAWLLMGTPQWQPPEELTPKALDAIATRAFAVVAGLGGVALLVIHYRRQRTTEADAVRAEAANVRAERAAERETAKLFTDSFDSASEKLGSEHAAVRLAGVHALARLANEVPEGREDLVQMVIDVLCAYLRMPYELAPNPLAKNASKDLREEHRKRELDFAAFREVRHTIIRIIGNHLRDNTRWRGKDYDLTGVVFDGGDLSGSVFDGGIVSFDNARFSGDQIFFRSVEFSGGRVSFHNAKFPNGKTSFHGARFSGSRVSFNYAQFSGGLVTFNSSEFSAGWVSFDRANFSDGRVFFGNSHFSGSEVSFDDAQFSGGDVSFVYVQFSDGDVPFRGAEFSGGEVSFRNASLFGGRVFFGDVQFSGSKVSFDNFRFSGGDALFSDAQFFDGDISFRSARFSSGNVTFDDASGTCPIGLLEAKENGEPGVVLLPQEWHRSTGLDSGKEDPASSIEDDPISGDP